MNVEILKQKGYRFLWTNNHLWMWDIPVEQKIQKRISNEAFGNVLVAGYGLGLIQSFLLQNEKVNSVLTLEKHIEVINICRKEYGELHGDIECINFYDFEGEKFDCIIGDIWDDIIPENLGEYELFKTKAEQLLKTNGKILAWGKEYFEYLIKSKTKK